jgi:alpha-amylase
MYFMQWSMLPDHDAPRSRLMTKDLGTEQKNAQRANYRVADVREHWAKLGQFRRAHIAVGAGVHQMIQSAPYVFKRTYDKDGVRDRVVVALGLPTDKRIAIPVRGVFSDGQTVRDAYSGATAVVANGMVQFPVQNPVALIAY